jgi:hypothetical protein
MNLVRNKIRDMLGGKTGQITFGKLSINLGLRAKRIPIRYNILNIGRVRTSRLLLLSYDSVCHAEGFGLLLARVVTVSPLWTPLNKNIIWNFRHTPIGQLFMLDQGCGLKASPSWVRRQFVVETRASKLKGTITKRCTFVDEISSSAGHT